jgi:hypothetical protein
MLVRVEFKMENNMTNNINELHKQLEQAETLYYKRAKDLPRIANVAELKEYEDYQKALLAHATICGGRYPWCAADEGL